MNRSPSFGTGKSILIVMATLVLILTIGATLYFIQNQQTTIPLSSFDIESIQISRPSENLTIAGLVYVASSTSQQTQGLQGMTNFGDCNGLAINTSECIGMIFVFPTDRDICLWMHNTIMPLQQ